MCLDGCPQQIRSESGAASETPLDPPEKLRWMSFLILFGHVKQLGCNLTGTDRGRVVFLLERYATRPFWGSVFERRQKRENFCSSFQELNKTAKRTRPCSSLCLEQQVQTAELQGQYFSWTRVL